MPRTSRARRAGRTVARALALSLGALSIPVSGADLMPVETVPEGWDASVEFGAQATSGASRTSSFSGATEMTYRGRRWEQRLVAKALHSSSSVRVVRRDETGEPVLDKGGRMLSRIVRERTNDRRFLALQSRFFFYADQDYLFAMTDAETNEPADIELSARLIGGIGHRFWRGKLNHFTAGIGVGRKRLEQVSGETEIGSIGYLGLSFVRRLGEGVTFEAGIDSDFGDENRFTELTLGLTWRLSDPVSVKLGYEARMNSDVSDPDNPFDERMDARARIGLEIDVL